MVETDFEEVKVGRGNRARTLMAELPARRINYVRRSRELVGLPRCLRCRPDRKREDTIPDAPTRSRTERELMAETDADCSDESCDQARAAFRTRNE